ncbi:MAG: T9SS C-terminal target domain-containing protein [Flavobacteriales bacterium]|nr:T9SS C-terminal target domain-containing protein [Flavobacteriales bacterium]
MNISLIGQSVNLLSTLDLTVLESSGLLFLEGRLITHNDSGNDPILYELDIFSGSVDREVVIENAVNVDWEDICYYADYIYVGDFGNNAGTRTDLKIYRVPISDYLTTTNDTVSADIIEFNYSDQSDFDPDLFNTNYDAEALIAWNDSLYIFTKNWGNNRTNIYPLSMNPGNYEISKVDSLDSQGLVTGATFNPYSNSIMLSGYTFSEPFIIEISGLTTNQFSAAEVIRSTISIPSGYSFQVEAVSSINADQYYISSEESIAGSAGLFRLETDTTVSAIDIRSEDFSIFPNPCSGFFSIDSQETIQKVVIYDMKGGLVKSIEHKDGRFDCTTIPAGRYQFFIYSDGKTIIEDMIIEH